MDDFLPAVVDGYSSDRAIVWLFMASMIALLLAIK